MMTRGWSFVSLILILHLTLPLLFLRLMVTSGYTFSRWGRRGGEYFMGEESKRLTLIWCSWHVVPMWEVVGEFRMVRVGNNQIGSNIVSPRSCRVAIMGGPIFPKHGKTQGSPWMGVLWDVSLGFFAMKSGGIQKSCLKDPIQRVWSKSIYKVPNMWKGWAR